MQKFRHSQTLPSQEASSAVSKLKLYVVSHKILTSIARCIFRSVRSSAEDGLAISLSCLTYSHLSLNLPLFPQICRRWENGNVQKTGRGRLTEISKPVGSWQHTFFRVILSRIIIEN
jgi:hypothetical protein